MGCHGVGVVAVVVAVVVVAVVVVVVVVVAAMAALEVKTGRRDGGGCQQRAAVWSVGCVQCAPSLRPRSRTRGNLG